MDAVEFLKEWKRMCDNVTDCKNCPIGNQHIPQSRNDCALFSFYNADTSVKIVDYWSKEHPRKTRLQDFLEKNPNAPIHGDGYPDEICPYNLGLEHGDCNEKLCEECWNKQID